MKKVLAIMLAAMMALSLTACGDATKKDDGNGDTSAAGNKESGSAADNNESDSVDLSKYPADFNDWTAQNVVDYFQEAVEFPSDCEAWTQNHAEYWSNMPVYECSGVWNADGADDVIAIFVTFNPDSPDTTPEEVEAVQKIIREDKNHDYTTEDIFLGPQDHMIGHVSFSYGATTTNDDVYNAIEDAYNYLVKEMGLTPDF